MLIRFVLLLFLIYVNGDCGCLRCSKHLQGIDITGPNGRPIKVIFEKPPLKTPMSPGTCSESTYSTAIQVPCSVSSLTSLSGRFYDYKLKHGSNENENRKSEINCNDNVAGQLYSAVVQVPVEEELRPHIPLCNLRYHTDTVLVPPPKCYNLQEEAVKNTFSIPPVKVCEVCQNQPICTCCCRCVDKTEVGLENKFARCKRSASSNVVQKYNNFDDFKRCTRSKRTIAKHGYNFILNMLPQFMRDPLHHGIQGSRSLRGSKPDINLKLEELKLRKALEYRNLYNHQESPKYTTKRPGLLNFKPIFPNNFKNNDQTSFGDRKQAYLSHFIPNGGRFNSHYSDISNKGTSPHFKLNRSFRKHQDEVNFENEQYSAYLDSFPQNKLSGLFQKRREPFSIPKLIAARLNNDEEADETILLRKLKKLNNNHLTSNLEDQATVFVQRLVSPERTTRRIKRSFNNLKMELNQDTEEELGIGDSEGRELVSEESCSKEDLKKQPRKKRTIILSSDEVDLPPQYEIDEVSVEDNDDGSGQVTGSSEELEDPNEEIVGGTPFTRRIPNKTFSRIFQSTKPDFLMGKNVIQKAVRDELSNYHKKMELEQKIKELRQNIEKKKNDPYGIGDTVPHNPIFMFLTAPMRFLRHFHDINKGINPVVTSLPKLVHTTKTYFRDFGKNFQKNCLNLASDIIGDFDHIQPNSVIQKIDQPHYGRYRRSISNENIKEDVAKLKSLCPDNFAEKNNKINLIVKECEDKSKKNDIGCFESIEEYLGDIRKELNSTSFGYLANFVDKVQGIIDYFSTSRNIEEFSHNQFTPDYSVVFSASTETQNFRKIASHHVRKKRYIMKIVNDDEVKDQVQDYLAQQLEDEHDYLKPLQDYYDKISNIWSRTQFDTEKITRTISEISADDSFEEVPKKKKIVVRKIKPRIIIDNKGLPFMEYKGFKRPLFLNKKRSEFLKSPKKSEPKSIEETSSKIDMLISRAKETSEVVGMTQNNLVPRQIVRERISSLLEEIDHLERLNAEDYDEIFENLIKIQYIKYSVEQDWKRILIENRGDDLHEQIGLLSKFKELQVLKDSTVQIISEALKKCDNEFVRRNLVHSLIRLEKLQGLITSVIDDFEQNLKMKTKLNTKKEIKYVNYLSDLNFVNAKTRNDLVKNLGRDRDREGQQNIDVLNKLKKILVSDNDEEMDKIAKTIWEMNNLKKLQTDTIKDINKKMKKYYRIKKELKILFDLQKRFEECGYELGELLGNVQVSNTSINNRKPLKKDIKEIIAEIKRKREETLQKALTRRSSLLRKNG